MSSTDVRIQLPERYRVVRHVANGGMASVWAAEDSVLGRLVAVKVLAHHVAADPSSRTRFEREARMAAKVGDHPNVVTIYDVGEHAGLPFIVMELFGGGSVADRLRGGARVAQSQALTWLEQTAAALDHAHAQGIVHRDVKPANLLLDERGRVAVGDFGIARLVDDSSLTQAGQVLGTAAYLSPEQALGRDATDASDRYALGILAFELLAGRRPFQGEHVAAQARQHVEAEPPASGLGPSVDAVLHRAIAKDPDERYLTASRFVEELEHTVARTSSPATEPTRAVQRARPAPPPPRAERRSDPPIGGTQRRSRDSHPARRGRGGLLALAALGVLAILVAVVALASSGGDGGSQNRAQDDPPAQTQPQDTQPEQQQQQEQPQAQQPEQAPDNEPESGPGPDAGGESPSTLDAQGYQLIQDGQPQEAIPYLEAAVKGFQEQGESADPTGYGYALYNLGTAYLQTGRAEEAIPLFNKRLEVSPDDRPEVVRKSLKEAQKAAQGKGSGGAQTEGDAD